MDRGCLRYGGDLQGRDRTRIHLISQKIENTEFPACGNFPASAAGLASCFQETVPTVHSKAGLCGVMHAFCCIVCRTVCRFERQASLFWKAREPNAIDTRLSDRIFRKAASRLKALFINDGGTIESIRHFISKRLMTTTPVGHSPVPSPPHIEKRDGVPTWMLHNSADKETGCRHGLSMAATMRDRKTENRPVVCEIGNADHDGPADRRGMLWDFAKGDTFMLCEGRDSPEKPKVKRDISASPPLPEDRKKIKS